ncbi:MAG TPA: GerMN domain-containing protein [Candidatus Acidoferrales bacterium]|nr:GerMN domain-containing protein [Candidatus Acidoferrales bacterium]
MSRAMKITVVILLLGVVGGAVYFHGLLGRVLQLARPTRSEEQARREVLQPPIATPSDTKVKARIFWASTDAPGTLAPVEVDLALSADAVQRAKQVLDTLITSPPAPVQRTLPGDATLLEFYVLEDGTAIADFSGELSAGTPSGILSEQRAVDSIARTLEANVPGLTRLKILIHGQEAETLAGHLDLTGMFALGAPATGAPSASEKPAAEKLTAAEGAVKLPR